MGYTMLQEAIRRRQPRNIKIQVRVSQAEKEDWENLAQQLGMHVTGLVRVVMQEALRGNTESTPQVSDSTIPSVPDSSPVQTASPESQ